MIEDGERLEIKHSEPTQDSDQSHWKQVWETKNDEEIRYGGEDSLEEGQDSPDDLQEQN
jgi:hypothetical protein